MIDIDPPKDKTITERFITYADKVGEILFAEKKHINFEGIPGKAKSLVSFLLKKKKQPAKKVEARRKVNIRELVRNVTTDEKSIKRLTGAVVLLLIIGLVVLFILWIFSTTISYLLQSTPIWMIVLITLGMFIPVVAGVAVWFAKRYDYD